MQCLCTGSRTMSKPYPKGHQSWWPASRSAGFGWGSMANSFSLKKIQSYWRRDRDNTLYCLIFYSTFKKCLALFYWGRKIGNCRCYSTMNLGDLFLEELLPFLWHAEQNKMETKIIWGLSLDLHYCPFSVPSTKRLNVAMVGLRAGPGTLRARGRTLQKSCKNQAFSLRRKADFCGS